MFGLTALGLQGFRISRVSGFRIRVGFWGGGG